MHVNATLDVDLVAVEQTDDLTVMLELVAPAAPEREPRRPVAVQVVLDRSGSMSGERIAAARDALTALVDRLAPTDQLGVVIFDHVAEIAIPAGPLADKRAAKAAIAAIEPRGATNLSAGLLRGLQEARRAQGAGGATLLLLSDGMANDGVVDPDQLAGVAAQAHTHGIATSTVGIGLGYDETLLAAIAGGGSGGHAFAQDGDAAASVVAGEVDGLLSKTVQAASLLILPKAPVETIALHNDLPAHPVAGGVQVELGDLWASEQRTVLLSLEIPAMAGLGLAEVATLELRSVALPALVEEVVTIPLHVNVVPGDEAADRIRNPKVVTELLFQRTQAAKRDAAEAIARGDLDSAMHSFASAVDELRDYAPSVPELAEEQQIVEAMRTRIAFGDAGDAAWAAKHARAEHHRKGRRRGRGE